MQQLKENICQFIFFITHFFLQDSLSNEDSPTEFPHRRSGDIRECMETTSSMNLAIGNDENTSKASCSSVSSLFDFEINQLKEMFPCCSPDILAEAREKCCDFEDAVDFVMHHQSNKSTEGISLSL